MAKKRGLGRGLDALIPAGTAINARGVSEIPVNAIMRNPRQPRSKIDPAQLAELADSIREHGVIQPLIVTRSKGDKYLLIAGERRLQAAKKVGLRVVPTVVREAATNRELLELALVENIQRTDLSPLESAVAFQTLADEFDLSHDQIAKRVGKQRTTVSNTLRLLKLSKQVQQALSRGEISEGHARALLGLRRAQAQMAVLETINKNGLNVRQTEELVRKMSGVKTSKAPAVQQSPEEKDLESRFRDSLGTKVNLKRNKEGKGTLVIHFYSDEELETLSERLLDL